MSVIPSLKPLSDKRPVGPANDRLADSQTTAAPTPAATGQPETRQTLRRYVGPKGERRPDGEKRRAVGRRAPACGEN